MIIPHVLISSLGHDQASCLLTGKSTPPSREHLCPQPHVQSSTHFMFWNMQTCVYINAHVCRAYLYCFPILYTWGVCHAQALLLFHHPGQVWSSPGAWSLHPLYLFHASGSCLDIPSPSQLDPPWDSIFFRVGNIKGLKDPCDSMYL